MIPMPYLHPIFLHGSWVTVDPPAGWPWVLPFDIQRNGRRFRPEPSFDLLDHSGIQLLGGTDYYVDPVNGNNGNSGLDWDHALDDVWAAGAKADIRIMYLAPGRYAFTTGQGGYQGGPGNAKAMICPNGIAEMIAAKLVLSYSAVGNHYNAASTTQIDDCFDMSSEDATGKYLRYTHAANEAGVDATPGSWYWAANVFHVRTFDDRAPDADIIPQRTNTNGLYRTFGAGGDANLYFENLRVMFASAQLCQLAIVAPAVVSKAYFKNCEMSNYYGAGEGMNIDGLTETISQKVHIHNIAQDGFNYHAGQGVAPKSIEIDCIAEYCNNGVGSTFQCSSTHDGSIVVRINGRYGYCGGPAIADVTNSDAWLLGCELHHPNPSAGNKRGYFGDTQNAYLDRVYLHDIQHEQLYAEGVGDAVYYRYPALDKALSTGGAGTVAPY